jgi:hypothetical protein
VEVDTLNQQSDLWAAPEDELINGSIVKALLSG